MARELTRALYTKVGGGAAPLAVLYREDAEAKLAPVIAALCDDASPGEPDEEIEVQFPLHTKKAEQRLDHGRQFDVEEYCDVADMKRTILLATEEREDFETDASVSLDEDTLPTETFERLLAWLKNGGAL
jgi:hypothetical protein